MNLITQIRSDVSSLNGTRSGAGACHIFTSCGAAHGEGGGGGDDGDLNMGVHDQQISGECATSEKTHGGKGGGGRTHDVPHPGKGDGCEPHPFEEDREDREDEREEHGGGKHV